MGLTQAKYSPSSPYQENPTWDQRYSSANTFSVLSTPSRVSSGFGTQELENPNGNTRAVLLALSRFRAFAVLQFRQGSIQAKSSLGSEATEPSGEAPPAGAASRVAASSGATSPCSISLEGPDDSYGEPSALPFGCAVS